MCKKVWSRQGSFWALQYETNDGISWHSCQLILYKEGQAQRKRRMDQAPDVFLIDWSVENRDDRETQDVGRERVGMKRLFVYAEKYIAKSDWKDLAMLKFCLFSMGVLAGMRIPEEKRRKAGWIAAAVFAATYIPLMAKFFSVVREGEA